MKKTLLIFLAVSLFCMLVMTSCRIFGTFDITVSEDGTLSVETNESSNGITADDTNGSLPQIDDWAGNETSVDVSVAVSSSDSNEVEFNFGQSTASTTEAPSREESSKESSYFVTSSAVTSSRETSSSESSSSGSTIVLPPYSPSSSDSSSGSVIVIPPPTTSSQSPETPPATGTSSDWEDSDGPGWIDGWY